MTKFYFSAILVFLSYFGKAQAITANDSANTGPGNINMVFYSLSTGDQTITSDTDWHLAVSVRATQFPNNTLAGTTIRINDAIGVKAYIAQNADSNSFATLDTTGWQSWRQLHNADTSIDEGALNSNRNHSNIIDYGWGQYTYYTSAHNVLGDSVYLIQLPSGELKKLIVVALVFDTAWDIKYSNLDNSDLQYTHIVKGFYDGTGIQYGSKEFMYVNLYSNTVLDKEPAGSDWDMQCLRYANNNASGSEAYPVPGVWINDGTGSNKATTVAKVTGAGAFSNSYSGLTFSGNLNTIGWNWKPFEDTANIVQDSLAYFIKTQGGPVYKIVFTGYNDTTGIMSFNSQLVTGLGVQEPVPAPQITIFPNPADQTVNILHPFDAGSKYQVVDISGNIVVSGAVSTGFIQINTAKLPAGFYLVNIISDTHIITQKLTVEHGY